MLIVFLGMYAYAQSRESALLGERYILYVQVDGCSCLQPVLVSMHLKVHGFTVMFYTIFSKRKQLLSLLVFFPPKVVKTLVLYKNCIM